MRRYYFVGLLILLIVSNVQAQRETITVDGLERTFEIHLPLGYEETQNYPLVIVLHGGGGNIRGMKNLTDFNELADEEGFIVVYPAGIEGHWNDGRGLEGRRAHRENIDDTNFIRTLIDHISQQANIDEQRIYATGISNGGHMSYRLACELSDKIAAIGVVTANLSTALHEICQPAETVAVLIMNGTQDPLIPYEGGERIIMNDNLGEVFSTEATVNFWTTHNRCEGEPMKTQLPDTTAFDGTRVLLATYEGCDGTSRVYLYTVVGGGHTWPGGPQYLPRAIIGRVSRDVDGSAVIWDFFKAHTLD